MTSQKLNKEGLTKEQAIAATGVTLLAGWMLRPIAKQFVNELLWDGAELEELSSHGGNSLTDPRNLTGMIVSLAVGAVCRKSAAALIKNGPELLSSWGDEIMKHGGMALCRMHETIADAGSSVLDFAKDAIGLNTDAAVDVVSEVASAGSDVATEAASTLASVGGDTIGEASGSGFFDGLLDKLGEAISEMA